jgi:diguanylate cyclase (GGDEF)-like protein/PAS domain S-box-containing protein
MPAPAPSVLRRLRPRAARLLGAATGGGTLGTFRWLFLLFALVVLASSIGMVLSARAPVGLQLAGLAALACLGALWVAAHRRGGLPWPLDVLEGAALLAVGLAGGAPQTLGVTYAGLYRRSLFGTWRRVGAGVVLYASAHLLALALTPVKLGGYTLAVAIPQIPQMAITAALVHTLARSLRRHERATARERALRASAAALIAAPDRLAVARTAVSHGLELVGRTPGAVAAVWLGGSQEMSLVASAGADEGIAPGVTLALDVLPAPMHAAVLAGRPVHADEGARLAASGRVAFRPKSGSLSLLPLLAGGELAGLLVVACDTVLEVDSRNALEALAGEVALALESSHLAEARHERRAERRLAALVDDAGELVTMVDGVGAITYQTPAVERVLGHARQALVGTPFLALVHPDDAGAVRAQLAGADAVEGHAGEFACRLRHGDGRWIEAETAMSNLLATPEVEALVLTTRDVTARRLADARLRRQATQQAAVAALGRRALAGLPLSQLMDETVRLVVDTLAVQRAAVLEHVDDEDSLVIRASCGWRADEARGARVPDVTATGLHAAARVPIGDLERPFGVLVAHAARPGSLGEDDGAFLEAVANVLAAGIARQRVEDEIRHHALHDHLTGLPNRTLFLDRLTHALAAARRDASTCAVLFLDLDDFKAINDTLGHEAGDELLAAITPRLRAAARATDTVARFGGDEFVVLCERLANVHEAMAVAARIAEAVGQPCTVRGREQVVGVTAGIALSSAEQAPATLVANADAAMYRAKQRARGTVELFDEQLRADLVERVALEADLRRALERDELHLHYQPVVSLRDGAITGVEALLRWEHPERGSVSPAVFIPVAEQSDLILRIGAWVLDEACAQAARWSRRLGASLRMNVNLSARQIATAGTVDVVSGALARSGLDPSRLVLEITETVLMEESEAPLATLEALRALGVGVALDDFGTGYSSLSYLKRFPIETLKIDRSFVSGMLASDEDAAIVTAVLAMAQAMGVGVVAEGVETGEQIRSLRESGCDAAQGFGLHRPMAAAAIGVLLSGAASRRPALPAEAPALSSPLAAGRPRA